MSSSCRRTNLRAAAPAAAPASPDGGAPLDELLRQARAALGEDAAPASAPRAAQLSHAMSGGRIAGLALAPGGGWVAQVGGRAVPERALPPRDRELAFLAVKLALLERALAGGRRVAVLDDVFAQLPEAPRRVAARFLKLAARPGQILHATADAACREAADHVAQAQP